MGASVNFGPHMGTAPRHSQMESSLTSLAQSLEARQTKLERLEALVRVSPIVMFTCKAGGDFACTFVTEGVRTLWGYEPEDFMLQARFWADRIHRDDITSVYDHLARVVQNGAHRFDYRFLTKLGAYRWTHAELRLVKDAILSAFLRQFHETGLLA